MTPPQRFYLFPLKVFENCFSVVELLYLFVNDYVTNSKYRRDWRLLKSNLLYFLNGISLFISTKILMYHEVILCIFPHESSSKENINSKIGKRPTQNVYTYYIKDLSRVVWQKRGSHICYYLCYYQEFCFPLLISLSEKHFLE